MTDPDSQDRVTQLLASLESAEAAERKQAADDLAQLNDTRPEIAAALRRAAIADPEPWVRAAAEDARLKLGFRGPPPVTDPVASKRRQEFMQGFFGGIMANLGLGFLAWMILQLPLDYVVIGQIENIFGFIVLALNVGALIYLGFRRPQAALGILGAYAAFFGLVLCLGLFIVTLCWAGSINL